MYEYIKKIIQIYILLYIGDEIPVKLIPIFSDIRRIFVTDI